MIDTRARSYQVRDCPGSTLASVDMPFADDLINASTAHTLTRAIEAAAPDRGRASALRAAAATLDQDRSLRLRERADLLSDALLADLPGDLDSLGATVRAAAAGHLPFDGWLIWPVTNAVATRAVAEGTGRAVDTALDLLADLTGRLSAEFALRVLLNHELDRTLDRIAGWTGSPDVDVRRLASEGTRPYLPWATRVGALLARPEATLPILDMLYRDDSAYVRRSVANHLNDLSRHAPALAVDTAARWLADPAPQPHSSSGTGYGRSSSRPTRAPCACSATRPPTTCTSTAPSSTRRPCRSTAS